MEVIRLPQIQTLEVYKTLIRFSPYRININDCGSWRSYREGLHDQLGQSAIYNARQNRLPEAYLDRRTQDWLDNNGKRHLEIKTDPTPFPSQRLYETTVLRMLQKISSTQIGRLLLASLNPNVEVWIVPLDLQDYEEWTGVPASTIEAFPREGGGIRVYFNPIGIGPDWLNQTPASPLSLRPDDVLFHELVHVSRHNVAFNDRLWDPISGFDTGEEFIAIHIQNIYREQTGHTRLYPDYGYSKWLSKNSLYKHLSMNMDSLMLFRHFVETDPLAATIAKIRLPADSYNPFRDLPVLERMWLSGSGIRQIPSYRSFR